MTQAFSTDHLYIIWSHTRMYYGPFTFHWLNSVQFN